MASKIFFHKDEWAFKPIHENLGSFGEFYSFLFLTLSIWDEKELQKEIDKIDKI